MTLKSFIRARWLDARFGLIYAGFVLSFVTAATVTYADIPQMHALTSNFVLYFLAALLLGGFVFSPTIGYLHRKYQNPTDIMLANAPFFAEVRRIVREELDKSQPTESSSNNTA